MMGEAVADGTDMLGHQVGKGQWSGLCLVRVERVVLLGAMGAFRRQRQDMRRQAHHSPAPHFLVPTRVGQQVSHLCWVVQHGDRDFRGGCRDRGERSGAASMCQVPC